MIYLASPYTHRDPHVVNCRFYDTKRAFAYMLQAGEHVYSPIVLCHQVSIDYRLPSDADYWEKFDFNFLRRCDELRILMLDDWKESRGVRAEIKAATAIHLPITYWKLGINAVFHHPKPED